MSQTIPKKDADFDEVQNVITTKAAANLNVWKIDSTWYNGQILPAKTAWTTAWAAWQNPVTRTKLIVFNKNEARKNYEQPLSKLVGILKASPFVTPSQLAEMGRGRKS